MKKTVITSFDTVSAAGIGIDEFTKNISTKKGNISDIRTFDTGGCLSKKAFVLNDINFEELLGKSGLKHINRNAKLSFSAIERRLLKEFKNLPQDKKPGLIMGTAFGSVDSIAGFWETYLLEGNNNLRPLEFPNTVINTASSFVNVRYGLSAISASVCNGYNSSLDAFIYAHDHISIGYGDFLIVGGCEELGKYLLLGQESTGVISKTGTMKPFGKKRSGYIPGEGGAFFMYESSDHAEQRNAKPLAELAGFSSIFSTDKRHGAVTAYNEALNMACIKPSDLDLVSSSANGGKNDSIIYEVYNDIFGKELPCIAVHKTLFGECYGASGALQIAASLVNFMEGKISPHIFEEFPEGISGKTFETKSGYFAVDGISCEGNSSVLIFKYVG